MMMVKAPYKISALKLINADSELADLANIRPKLLCFAHVVIRLPFALVFIPWLPPL